MNSKEVRSVMEAYASVYEGYKEKEEKGEKEEKNCVDKEDKGKHNCAKKVCHEQFGEGTCIFGEHAVPDENGFVSHYDVLFNHGVEKDVPVSEMEVLEEGSHNEDYHRYEGEQIAEGDLGDRARRVVGDQRGGYHGDADYFKRHQDAIDQRLLQMRPYGVKGFPSVKKDTKKTTQVAHFEPEGELVDESGYFPTPESQRRDYEKHKPNLSTGELPGRHKPVKRNPDGSLKREEVQLVSEAEERVLVRITTEDGRVFEKKVPKDKISELRQRYKSVVEVGSSDSKPKMTSKQAGSDMKESKDKPKRWWDDDGDGVGYEEGEVSGKFKRKKKTKKESYSDWRSDMDLSEEQLGVSPREMRSQGNEKKK